MDKQTIDKQQQSSNTCEQCGSPSIHSETVRSAFWHDDQLVVVEDIPALVCGNCHEQFYDDVTVILLDLFHGEGYPRDEARKEISVPVFSLQDIIKRGEKK
ncbi:MAG: YgiT-type zinc finger protein [Rhodospirillaceae bacterium]|nr:YgiT-type zinc finger protein [Rhodospirillaceae bacterium]